MTTTEIQQPLTPRQRRYWGNKEKENKVSREYYAKNKATTNKKYICDCGGLFTKNNIYNHRQTKRHKDYINHTGIFLRERYE